MRVTQNMMSQQFLYNLSNTNSTMLSLENQISSGKTLNLPSDNPLGVSQDMTVRNMLSQTTTYTQTINVGTSWMQSTTSVMQEISQSLQSIQSDVITGINTTNQNATGKTALSKTVQEYAKQIYGLLNTKQGNQYLFGGTTGTPPVVSVTPSSSIPLGYELATGTGIASNVAFQFAQGIKININITASEIMSAPLTSGTSLETTLQNLGADLQNGNSANLQKDLQNINAAISSVTNLNAGLGARMQRVTAIQNQINQYSYTLKNQKGVIEGANMAQVITQFSTDQISYQAALKMGAQILTPSLVSFLP